MQLELMRSAARHGKALIRPAADIERGHDLPGDVEGALREKDLATLQVRLI